MFPAGAHMYIPRPIGRRAGLAGQSKARSATANRRRILNNQTSCTCVRWGRRIREELRVVLSWESDRNMYRVKFEVNLLSGGFATRLGFSDVSAKSSQSVIIINLRRSQLGSSVLGEDAQTDYNSHSQGPAAEG